MSKSNHGHKTQNGVRSPFLREDNDQTLNLFDIFSHISAAYKLFFPGHFTRLSAGTRAVCAERHAGKGRTHTLEVGVSTPHPPAPHSTAHGKIPLVLNAEKQNFNLKISDPEEGGWVPHPPSQGFGRSRTAWLRLRARLTDSDHGCLSTNPCVGDNDYVKRRHPWESHFHFDTQHANGPLLVWRPKVTSPT